MKLNGPGCLNYPLYLPLRIRHVTQWLAQGDIAGAVAELNRLATLGSNDAKVVLGYLHLQGGLPNGIDLDTAESLLRGPASDGDSYALYVLGWVYFLRDKSAQKAVRCWLLGEKAGFAPSVLELGRFLTWDLPGRPPKISEAVEKLELAKRLGHKQAAGVIAAIDANGGRGLALKLTSTPRWILAFCNLYFWTRKDFFSVNVFARPLQPKRPFFRNP